MLLSAMAGGGDRGRRSGHGAVRYPLEEVRDVSAVALHRLLF